MEIAVRRELITANNELSFEESGALIRSACSVDWDNDEAVAAWLSSQSEALTETLSNQKVSIPTKEALCLFLDSLEFTLSTDAHSHLCLNSLSGDRSEKCCDTSS